VNTNESLAIDCDRAALIIQDMQNDVIAEGGAFADSGAPLHAAEQNVVENCSRLADACRKAGIPVIHVWYVVEQDARGLKLNAPLFEGVQKNGALVKGSWGAEPVPGLERRPGDLLVEKMRMSAWQGTKLENLLAGLGRDTIVVTGAWTNMSIEHTARHAADAGYEVVVVADATSTINDEWQHAALNYALTNVGEVGTTQEVLAALGVRAPARRKAAERRSAAAARRR